MRWLLTMTSLILAASTASAVDQRWTLTSNGEGLSATIDGKKSAITILCFLPPQVIGRPPTPWSSAIMLELETLILKDGANEAAVQFIVDGKIYPFRWDKYRFVLPILADNQERDFHEVVTALASSNQKTFVVRFPEYTHSETFSLLDARKVLGSGKDFILDRCENPPQQ